MQHSMIYPGQCETPRGDFRPIPVPVKMGCRVDEICRHFFLSKSSDNELMQ